jgi:hypothetical protein
MLRACVLEHQKS